MTALLGRIGTFGRMIRFSHSVFALPFALASMVLAAEGVGVSLRTGLLIVVAMIAARSAAMGFNRLADHAIDARNPRTATRELPRGAVRRSEVWIFVVGSAALFVLASFLLNPLCFALSPVALFVVFGYSFTKRFTSLAHLVLGLSLAIAPVGAWLAVRGSFAWTPVVLGLGVLGWVAGFDILYSCQDLEVDRREGLHSVPAALGIRGALLAARACHVGAILALGAVYLLAPLHPAYLAGVGLVAGLLFYEHSLVKPDDLSRLDMAFFTVNGWVSVLYFVCTVSATYLRGTV
jgi:4-hydroxybenzoate polyprenyltransferase